MMSLIHLTGDTALLDGAIRPKVVMMGGFQGGLGEEDQARVRALALQALKEYRDRGCTLPAQPSAAQVQAMMNFMVGARVGDEYVPMMLEELALDGNDSRAPRWSREIPASVREKFHVLIVGAGMAGILQALRLKEAGIPFTLVEKNDSVGGTWYENRYPGCRVDIANHFYSYSFEPYAWSEYFSRRDELLAYFRNFVKRHGLEAHIRYNTEMTAAHYDEKTATWEVDLKSNGGGAPRKLRANAIISAVGQLNRPRIPDIADRETFQGRQVHSAQWDPQLDLAGQRVAVLGSGASAFQLVPEVAKVAAKLYVFQRSAPWMLPNPLYHEAVSPQFRWLVQHVPYYARWFRFLIFYPGSDGILPALRIDKEWLRIRARRQRAQRPLPNAAVRVHEEPGERQSRAAGEGDAKIPVHGQAHAAGQRQLVARAAATERGTDIRRCYASGCHRHRRLKPPLRGRHHRLRHRLPRHQIPVADARRRQGRQTPARSVGR
jgi:4-hydroxyacetophenone monooxygenase